MIKSIITKQCITCEKTFAKKSSTSMKEWATQTKFCSYSCRRFTPEQKAKISATKVATGTYKGEKHHNWKGGTALQYKSVQVSGKKTTAHRSVMESLIGRALKTIEVVHHWDENKFNNEPSNLCLFRSQSAHQKLHAYAKRNNISINTLKFMQPWLITSITHT